MKKVVVIGQGYVGLPLAIASAVAGFKVIGFDHDHDIVESLNKGESHVEDISSSVLQELIVKGVYRASYDFSDLTDCEIAIIAVPTPLDLARQPDLSFVKAASVTLGKYLNTSALIINESTSYPGTLRNIIAPIVSENSINNLKHLFAISPERVDPGNLKWNIKTTPRLFSGLTNEATRAARDFYSSFCDEIVEVSTPEIAESAKLFENTFRQVNIALVNEFALIMRAMNIPVHEVLSAAATKPHGFMKFVPGLGVGGHCIPVDPSYLAFISREVGVAPKFIELANNVNRDMPKYVIERIKNRNGGNLSKKKILICGMSYKANISDVRESPSLELYEELQSVGANVIWHDDLVSKIGGTKSTKIENNIADITILAVNHAYMDLNQIYKSADYVFDCVGVIKGSDTL